MIKEVEPGVGDVPDGGLCGTAEVFGGANCAAAWVVTRAVIRTELLNQATGDDGAANAYTSRNIFRGFLTLNAILLFAIARTQSLPVDDLQCLGRNGDHRKSLQRHQTYRSADESVPWRKR